MKILFFLLLVPVTFYSQIQTITSQKNFGTAYNETGVSKIYGNYLYSFITPESPNVSIDKTLAGFGVTDGWLVKMDLNFNVLSQFVFGGTSFDNGVDFIECLNGDLMLLLSSFSGANGNKTIASFGNPSTVSSDYWLIRIDNSGTILWQKSYGGSDSDSPTNIIQISENRFLLTGHSNSPISGNKSVANFANGNIWSVFIDGQGDILSQFVYGGDQGEQFVNVRLNQDSSLLLYGASSFSDISGNKTTQLDGFVDGWIFTTDTMGNMINQTSYSNGSSTFTYLRAVEFNSNGEVIVGLDGETGLSGDKTVIGYGDNDAWIVKLDAALNELNQFVYGGVSSDGLYRMKSDGDNILLSVGSFSSSDGNKTEPAYGGIDNWIVCIDSNGVILWQKSAGGGLNDKDFTINKVSNNQYIVVSETLSGISGNKTVPLYVSGSSDLWYYKLSTTLGVEEHETSMIFSVAPNPFEDKISFSWDIEMKNVVIEIFNSTGQRIEKIDRIKSTVYQYSGEALSNGIYFFTISSELGLSKGKIIKR